MEVEWSEWSGVEWSGVEWSGVEWSIKKTIYRIKKNLFKGINKKTKYLIKKQ